jgi:polyribonucleotide nucleotidyltransferase
MKEVSVSVAIGDKTIILETGLLALQAKGSATVRLGDTIILSTACASD